MSVFFAPVSTYDQLGRPVYSMEITIPDSAIINKSQLSIETKLRLVERNYFIGRGSFFISFGGDAFLDAVGGVDNLPEGLRNGQLRIERGGRTIYRGIVESARTKNNNSVLELRVIDNFEITQSKRINLLEGDLSISTPHSLGNEFLQVDSFGNFTLTNRVFEGVVNQGVFSGGSGQSAVGIDAVGYHILKFQADTGNSKVIIDTFPHFEKDLIGRFAERGWGLRITNTTDSEIFYLDFSAAQVEGEGEDAVWTWSNVSNLSTLISPTAEMRVDIGVRINEEVLADLGEFWVDEDEVDFSGNTYDRYIFSDARDFPTSNGEVVGLNDFSWQGLDYRLSFFQLIQRNTGGQPDSHLTLSMGLEPDSELLANRRLDDDNWYLRVIFNNSQHEFAFRDATVSNAGTDREHYLWTLPAPISIPAQTTEKIEIANLGTFRTSNNQFSTAEAERRDSNAGVQGEIISDGQLEINDKIYKLSQLWGPDNTHLFLGIDPDDEVAGQLDGAPQSANWLFEITKIIEGGTNITFDFPLSDAGISFTGFGERWRWLFPLTDGTATHPFAAFGDGVYQVKIVRFVGGVNVRTEIRRRSFNTPNLTARRAAISILQNKLFQKVDSNFIQSVLLPKRASLNVESPVFVEEELAFMGRFRIVNRSDRITYARADPADIRPGFIAGSELEAGGITVNNITYTVSLILQFKRNRTILFGVDPDDEAVGGIPANAGWWLKLEKSDGTFTRYFDLSLALVREYGSFQHRWDIAGNIYNEFIPAGDYRVSIWRREVERTAERTGEYKNDLGVYYLEDNPDEITTTTRIGRMRGQLGRVRLAGGGAFNQFSTVGDDTFGGWGARIENGDLAWQHKRYDLVMLGFGTPHTTNAGKVWFGMEPDDEDDMVNDPNFSTWKLVITNETQNNSRHTFNLSDSVIQENIGPRFYWEGQEEMIEGLNNNDVVKVELVSDVVNFNEGRRRGDLGTVSVERIGVSDRYIFSTGEDLNELHGQQFIANTFFWNGHLHQLVFLEIHLGSNRIDVGWQPDDEENIKDNHGNWEVRVDNDTQGWFRRLLVSDSLFIEGTSPTEKFLRWEALDLTDEDGNALVVNDGDHFSVDIVAPTAVFDFAQTEQVINNPDQAGMYNPIRLVGGREEEGTLIFAGVSYVISQITTNQNGERMRIYFTPTPPLVAFDYNPFSETETGRNNLIITNIATGQQIIYNRRITYSSAESYVHWEFRTDATGDTAKSLYDIATLGTNFRIELVEEDTREEDITTPLNYSSLLIHNNDYELNENEFILNENGKSAGEILQKLLSPLNLYLVHNEEDEIEAKSNIIPITDPVKNYTTAEIVNNNFKVEDISESTLYTAISYNYPHIQGSVITPERNTSLQTEWEAYPIADTQSQRITELNNDIFLQDGRKLGFIDLFEKEDFRIPVNKKAVLPFLSINPAQNILPINPSERFPAANFSGTDDFRLFLQSGGPEDNDNDLWVGRIDTTRENDLTEVSAFGFLLRGSLPQITDGSNQILIWRLRKLATNDGFWFFFWDENDAAQTTIQTYIDNLATALASNSKKLFLLIEGFEPFQIEPDSADIIKESVLQLSRGNRKSIKIKHNSGESNYDDLVSAIRSIDRGKLFFLALSTKSYL